jgi:hypothetical protein
MNAFSLAAAIIERKKNGPNDEVGGAFFFSVDI